MAKYQVTIFQRPENWRPESPDDVPLDLIGPVAVLDESDDLFVAVGRAIEYNESAESPSQQRWAVVVESGTVGRIWPMGRLCTPITYQVTPIWWPDGWEPRTPLDVPNCAWQAPDSVESEWLSYSQAEAVVLSLNRQCMNEPGRTWYIVVATENEPVSRTVSYDAAGMETVVEVRPRHTMHPTKGQGGDCSHCPAGEFPCSQSPSASQPQTVPITHSRPWDANSALKP
jgi:hypothetical protein